MRWLSRAPKAARVSLAVLLAALLAAGATAPLALADSDELDLEHYDRLPPDAAWRDAVHLNEIPPEHDGAGVTVAVLDTGVTRHPDLGSRMPARVDLSPDRDGYDRYGHGTHMVGLVAGDGSASNGRWAGAAPGASVLPVKVASWNGATDVSQVVAALEWIADHRDQYGIRVVNLSYGTDSSQKVYEDPLNHAAQRLWRAGVLVVVSAGNRGDGGAKIEKPADDPWVLSVGAADTRGTATPFDDEVAPFSSRGPTGEQLDKPDLVAPGVSLVSHRAGGSTLDQVRPMARLDADYFKGTGTSQAAAVVSGIAARMFDANPALTPDEAKAALVGTTHWALRGSSGAGTGLVDAAAAVEAVRSGAYAGTTPVLQPSSGLGKLDSSRGEYKPYTDFKERGKPEQLSGEYSALGRSWDASAWASRSWSSPADWGSAEWAPHTAVSPGWGPAGWATAWSGLGWDESSWAGRRWGDVGIPDRDWSGRRWGASAWNGLD